MEEKHVYEVKTRIIYNRRKNGDIYVLERQMQYDPEAKFSRVLKSKLLAKIPKGSDKECPTRYRLKIPVKKSISPSKQEPAATASGSTADTLKVARTRIGMMKIIDWLGSVSGIDSDIYRSTDEGTARKILSLARCLLATTWQTLPGITEKDVP